MKNKEYESWKKLVLLLYRFATSYRNKILLVVFLLVLATGADLAEPIIYGFAIDDLAGVFVHNVSKQYQSEKEVKQNTRQAHRRGYIAPRTIGQALKTLLIAAALLLGLNILSHGLLIAADQVSARYSNSIEQDFITSVYQHVLKFPLSFFNKCSSAALAKQINQSDHVAPIITGVMQEMSIAAIRLLGILAIMITQHVTLALITMLTLPFYLIVSNRMARKLEGTSEIYYEQWDTVAENLQDSLSAIKTVKVSGAEDRVAQKFRESLAAVVANFLQRNTTENMYLFWQSVLVNIGRFFVLAYGGWRVYEHQLTPGDVVMFVAFLDKLYDPIDTLTSRYITLQNHKISVQRAIRLLRAEEEEVPGNPVTVSQGTIEFREISFQYKPGRLVLDRLSFSVPPKCVTALVGPSGAGKTTTFDLLLKFYTPLSGEIRIDGIPLRECDPFALRQEIGVVSTDGTIFRGTVKENLLFKNPDAAPDEITNVIRAAGLQKMVERLPSGLDTEIGEHGVGLSLGERQRIQIARVFLSKPKILLFDEATANLDYATESEIRETIKLLRRHSTIMIAAHRYSIVKDADHVIVLEKGRARACGTPTEVYQRNDWFRNMVDSSK